MQLNFISDNIFLNIFFLLQNMDDMNDPIQIQQTPQYTITLDGQTIKSNQIHYKIEAAKPIVAEQQQSQTFATPVSYQK